MSILNKIFHQCTFDPDKWKKVVETKITELVETPINSYVWATNFSENIKPFHEIQKGTDVTFTNTCLTCGMLHSKKIRY